MATDTPQNVILEFGVDYGDSLQKIKAITTLSKELGVSFEDAADKVEKALAKQSQAQEQAAKQSKRSTDAAVRTLQTEIAAREAGGRATARYYELIYTNSSKVDQQAIAPLIAKYKELEAQQVAAAAASKQRAEAEKKAAQDAAAAIKVQADALRASSAANERILASKTGGGGFTGLPDISGGTRQLEQMGMTAKATSAALRQVPAQFTDIVVSLQGGQAPLTVFLQQGGQLKDVFGGAGAAAAALGKYVLGLINPVTLAAAAVAALAYGYNQGATEVQRFNAALITSNNAAGTTSDKLADIAAGVANITNVTKGAAAEAVTAFAKSGAFNTDQIERFSTVAIRAQREVGTSVADTIAAFEKLGQKPLEASLKLNEGTNYLTRLLYEQIKALEEQGRVTEAAALAQSAYADASTSVADKLEKNLGTIERGWRNVKDASKSALDTLLEFGRKDAFVDQEQRINNRLSTLQSGLTGTADTPAVTGDLAEQYRKEIAQLTEVQRLLQKSKDSRLEAAEAQRTQNKLLNASVELDAVITKNLDKKATAEIQIATLRDKYGKEAAKDAAIALKLEEAIASVRAKAADKTPKQTVKIDENQRELAQYIESLEKRIGKEQELTEVQKAQRVVAKANTADANAQVQAYALFLAEQFDAEEKNSAARKAAAKAQADYNKELANSANSVEKSLEKYQLENAALALSKDQYISLEAAVNDLAIARLEEQLVKEKIANNPTGEAAIAEEIRLRRELAKEIRSKDARTETEKAAKDAATAWEKASDRIGDSITDALFRGFESGKGFIQNLVDTAQNAFKTMVLQPTVKGVVTSALGFPGVANAAGAASGVGALSGGFAALGTAFGSSLSAGFGATVSSFGAATGVAIEGGLASIATATGSGIASGLGQIAGALGPFALGAVGLYALTGGFKGEYAKSTGDASVAFDPMGNRTRTSTAAEIGGGRYTATLSADADKLVAGLNAAYLANIKSLGGTAKFTDFFFGGNNSDGGKFTLGAGVGGVGSVFNSGELKSGDEAVKLAASRAVFAALKASDLPGYLAKVFDGVTATGTSQEQIEQIDTAISFAGGLKQIRDALTETRTPLQVLQDTVDTAFAALDTSAATFKTDFVAAIDSGITPDKLAQFQALGVSLDQLAAASGKAGDSVRSVADIAAERATLQQQLDAATLSNVQILAKQREALDASNRALFDQVTAAEAAKEVAAERADLQQQLDDLTLTSTQALAQQRAALDESNRALFDQVQAAAAAAKAQEELSAAAEGMAERVKASVDSLSNTRFDLENQILTLQGATGEVATRTRTKDLAALTEGITSQAEIDRITAAYDYNQGLRDQIVALNASKKAAEDASQAQSAAADTQSRAAQEAVDAANRVRDAMKSIADSLTDAAAQIRGDIVKQGAGGFAAAQAQFTVTAAQAKAGDEAAAKSLPQLASALVQIAQTSATSEAQLRSVRASTAGTLDEVAALLAAKYGFQTTSTATVTTSVPTAQQQPTVPTQQTVVQPVFYNSITGQAAAPADSAATLAELAKITALLEALSTKTTVTAEDIATTRRVLQLVTRNGASMQVAAEAPGLLTRTS